jgi:hypothetical protein
MVATGFVHKGELALNHLRPGDMHGLMEPWC